LIGRILQETGERPEAVASYEWVTLIYPMQRRKAEEALRAKGRVRDRPMEQVRLEALTRSVPEVVREANYQAAQIQFDYGQFAEAAAKYSAFVQTAPNVQAAEVQAARLRQGIAHARAKQLPEAMRALKPLAESPLKHEILSLARAQGIPATDVYEFDASKQTKRMSAHVSGLLGTTQISMNDNLMNRGSHEEVKAVLGHEMGHYVLNHVYKGITFIGILIVAGFAFVRWSFEKLRASSAARWGIRDVGDVAGMPLLLFLLSAYFFVLTPVDNTITRTMEAEADNYGLNASREPDGFAQAALHLSEYRKMEPGPVEEWLFYDHPSGWHRIHRAMVWKAEHVGDADIAAYDAAHPAGAAGAAVSP